MCDGTETDRSGTEAHSGPLRVVVVVGTVAQLIHRRHYVVRGAYERGEGAHRVSLTEINAQVFPVDPGQTSCQV